MCIWRGQGTGEPCCVTDKPPWPRAPAVPEWCQGFLQGGCHGWCHPLRSRDSCSPAKDLGKAVSTTNSASSPVASQITHGSQSHGTCGCENLVADLRAGNGSGRPEPGCLFCSSDLLDWATGGAPGGVHLHTVPDVSAVGGPGGAGHCLGAWGLENVGGSRRAVGSAGQAPCPVGARLLGPAAGRALRGVQPRARAGGHWSPACLSADPRVPDTPQAGTRVCMS